MNAPQGELEMRGGEGGKRREQRMVMILLHMSNWIHFTNYLVPMATLLGHKHTVKGTLLLILSRKPHYIFPFYVSGRSKTANLSGCTCLLNFCSLQAAGLCVHKFLRVCVCVFVRGAAGNLLICA